MKKRLSVIALLALVPMVLQGGTIEEPLLKRLNSTAPDAKVIAIARLADRVDVDAMVQNLTEQQADRKQRYTAIVGALQEKASATQGSLVRYLEEGKQNGSVTAVEQFWLDNWVKFMATPDVVRAVASRPDVDVVFEEPEMFIDPPVAASPASSAVAAIETGVRVINAPALWRAGFTGSGRLVLGIDTGVRGDHIALASRWRGTLPGVQPNHAWYGSGSFPSDSDNPGHGTHTMGTMVGRNASTLDTLGVAPDAYWIAAASPYTGAFQWAVNPDGNPSTLDDVPDVINCSWFSSGDQCSGGSVYWSLMDNVEAIGVVVIWSAGNCGPSGSTSTCANGGTAPGPYKTITPPKNRVASDINAFSVGAIDGNNVQLPIATFSSRGPSACDTTFMKPNVSAPGVSVRSTYANGNFGTLSGTSMAAPHVAGAVALLRHAFPNSTVEQIKLALMATARDLGTPGRDNQFGAGLIDVMAAAEHLSPWQVSGVIRSSSTNQPIDRAIARIVQTSQEQQTGSSGTYSIKSLRDSVSIRFSAFGHRDSTILLVLTSGVPRVLNVTLSPLPTATVSGVVRDTVRTIGVPAHIQFYAAGDTGTGPTYTTTTQPNGSYSRPAMIGTYRLIAVTSAPYMDSIIVDNAVVTTSGLTQNFNAVESNALLVDDDGGASFELSYKNSLARAGLKARSFSVADSTVSPAGVLQAYYKRPLLVWITGGDTANALTATERQVIVNHLAGGGRLILAGLHAAEFSPANDTLFAKTLGVRFTGNSSSLNVRGFAGDIIGNGINYFAAGASKDILEIVGGSSGTPVKTLYYADTTQIAGVRVLGPSARWGATFFGFGLELLTAERMDTMIVRSIRFFNQQVTGVRELTTDATPSHYALEQNYPNPFNPVTTIRFSIAAGSKADTRATLKVFTLLGQEVATLVNDDLGAGAYEVSFDASKLASGMYIYRLSSGSYLQSRKMLLTK